MAKTKLEKIVKRSCLVCGFALYGFATYLYYYKGISNYLAGDYQHAVRYMWMSAPIFTTSQVLLVTSGFMYQKELKKVYQKIKTCLRGKKQANRIEDKIQEKNEAIEEKIEKMTEEER